MENSNEVSSRENIVSGTTSETTAKVTYWQQIKGSKYFPLLRILYVFIWFLGLIGASLLNHLYVVASIAGYALAAAFNGSPLSLRLIILLIPTLLAFLVALSLLRVVVPTWKRSILIIFPAMLLAYGIDYILWTTGTDAYLSATRTQREELNKEVADSVVAINESLEVDKSMEHPLKATFEFEVLKAGYYGFEIHILARSPRISAMNPNMNKLVDIEWGQKDLIAEKNVDLTLDGKSLEYTFKGTTADEKMTYGIIVGAKTELSGGNHIVEFEAKPMTKESILFESELKLSRSVSESMRYVLNQKVEYLYDAEGLVPKFGEPKLNHIIIEYNLERLFKDAEIKKATISNDYSFARIEFTKEALQDNKHLSDIDDWGLLGYNRSRIGSGENTENVLYKKSERCILFARQYGDTQDTYIVMVSKAKAGDNFCYGAFDYSHDFFER